MADDAAAKKEGRPVMSEPQTWALPAEPPVGTVVGPEDEASGFRWMRVHLMIAPGERKADWLLLRTAEGGEPNGDTYWTWRGLLCVVAPVREYPDPSDPDGRQSELDALRADVARLDQALRDAAENLTQAERDRDDKGVELDSARSWIGHLVFAVMGQWNPAVDRSGQASVALQRIRALVRERPEVPAVVHQWMERTDNGESVAVVAVGGDSGKEVARGRFQGYADRPQVAIKVAPGHRLMWDAQLVREASADAGSAVTS